MSSQCLARPGSIAALLQRAAAADESAFMDFYDRTAARVFRVARCVTGDDTTACDVVCTVYAGVWRDCLAGVHEARQPEAWLLARAYREATRVTRARRTGQ
ncbi:RNA polymerase sigma factor [Nocardioides sp.]|uniref:RNA polymerase sigma factor n=1 Tax=Nocardioides sp. TaxID=35761 RepID=UPI002733E362|nr:hypothetical protein [Nocardioides sp.]MDP3894446.1 hypothetical protein [Nocardioides sp.]